MNSEEALERVVLASVRCVIAGDNIHLITLPDRRVVGVVTVQAEWPEVVGEVAYLSTLADDGVWRPVVLDDGTVSDGKVETYTRCVEHLCGSADTFFTSVFGAQGKRQLSDYRNGEIKTLLADLLAQDQIRELGAKASQTAKLLKAGLVGIRQELAVIVEDEEAAACGLAKAADAPARAQQAQFAASKAAERREELSQSCARLMAQRDQSRETDARRSQLQEERSAAQAADLAAIRDLGERERLDRQRLERLDQRCAQRAEQTRRRRERAQAAQVQCVALLSRAPLVERAVKRLPLAERVLPMRAGRLLQAREAVTAWESARSAMRLGEQRVEAIEREAGQAALRAQSLSRRFALTREVPCSGMALQGDCQLLADAREAKALIPSAEGVLQRLAAERTQALADVQLARGRVEATSSAEAQLQREEDRLERSRARASRYALLAGKAEEIAGTRLRLAEANEELKGTAEVDGDPEPARQEQEERECILASLRGIEGQRRTQSEQLQKSLARIDALLQALPMPFDGRALRAAEADRDRAAAQCEALQAAHLEAVRQSQALVELRRAQQQLGQRRVSTATPAKLDFRTAGAADEGFVDAMPTGSLSSMRVRRPWACASSICHPKSPRFARDVRHMAMPRRLPRALPCSSEPRRRRHRETKKSPTTLR